jgi:hypothetical protein
MSMSSLTFAGKAFPVRQLPASYTAPPHYGVAPLRDFGNESTFYAGEPGGARPLETLQTELEINPMVTADMIYTSPCSPRPLDYHQGEIMFKINDPETLQKNGPVKVCGVCELVDLFRRAENTSFDVSQLQFIGTFRDNRQQKTGGPINVAHRSTVGVVVIEGHTQVMPYLGKDVYPHQNMYIAILPVSDKGKNRYRVFPHSSRSNSPLVVLRELYELLKSKKSADLPWVPIEDGKAFCARIGRVRANGGERYTREACTLDVPNYNLDFLRHRTSMPIDICVDCRKTYVTLKWFARNVVAESSLQFRRLYPHTNNDEVTYSSPPTNKGTRDEHLEEGDVGEEGREYFQANPTQEPHHGPESGAENSSHASPMDKTEIGSFAYKRVNAHGTQLTANASRQAEHQQRLGRTASSPALHSFSASGGQQQGPQAPTARRNEQVAQRPREQGHKGMFDFRQMVFRESDLVGFEQPLIRNELPLSPMRKKDSENIPGMAGGGSGGGSGHTEVDPEYDVKGMLDSFLASNATEKRAPFTIPHATGDGAGFTEEHFVDAQEGDIFLTSHTKDGSSSGTKVPTEGCEPRFLQDGSELMSVDPGVSPEGRGRRRASSPHLSSEASGGVPLAKKEKKKTKP